MRERLIQAILVRNFGQTQEYLRNGAVNNVSDNDLENVAPVLNQPGRNLALSSLVHVAAATNNPKVLTLLINGYRANVPHIEQNSQSKFLSVLLNREFNTNVSTFSALKNLDILYRSGASIPESAVDQLIVNYDHMPECRDNLRMIIQKLHILKATHAFLDHVKNNRINDARRIRASNINVLYPHLARLNISGYINPYYDAGVHSTALLIAAELPIERQSVQMLDFLSQPVLRWDPRVDLCLSNAEGMTLFHAVAMTGNRDALQWLFNKLNNKDQVLQLLTKKIVRPDGQQFTPMALARLYNRHTIVTAFQAFATQNNDLFFAQVLTENPDKLRILHEIGFHFNRVHSTELGNSLHYAVLGRVPANARWLWNRFSVLERVQFLLGKMQYPINGTVELVSPLQLAERLGRDNLVRALQNFAVELVGVVEPAILRELQNAGYDCNELRNAPVPLLFAPLARQASPDPLNNADANFPGGRKRSHFEMNEGDTAVETAASASSANAPQF